MRCCLVLAVSLCSLPAFADCYLAALTQSAEALEDARILAKQGGGNCKSAMKQQLKRGIDELDSFRARVPVQQLIATRGFLSNLLLSAPANQCAPGVSDKLRVSISTLDAAILTLTAPNDDQRVRRRRGHVDHDDDARGPPPGQNQGGPRATLAPLRVTYDQLVAGEPTIRVDIPSAALTGIGRSTYYFGGRFRREGGQWSEWVTSNTAIAPQDPFAWNDVYSQHFRMRDLQPQPGRFTVRMSIFDANRTELAFQETTIDLRGSEPVRLERPRPIAALPPTPRDCGTNPDAGCELQRNGNWAMDAVTFNGFIAGLRGNNSDLVRLDMVRSVLGNSYLTAKQLGVVLDLFSSDLVKLDAARVAAPHVINPPHALGLASKFRSSLLQRDFTSLMSSQR